MGSTISIACASISAVTACASVKLAIMIFNMNYEAARDIHKINESIERIETILRGLVAARQRKKLTPTLPLPNDPSLSDSSSPDSELDDDWWCLFTQPDDDDAKEH